MSKTLKEHIYEMSMKSVFMSLEGRGFEHVATWEGHWIMRDNEGNQVYYEPKSDSISPYGGQIECYRNN